VGQSSDRYVELNPVQSSERQASIMKVNYYLQKPWLGYQRREKESERIVHSPKIPHSSGTHSDHNSKP
jgi:hypothetical protein